MAAAGYSLMSWGTNRECLGTQEDGEGYWDYFGRYLDIRKVVEVVVKTVNQIEAWLMSLRTGL